MNRLVNVALNYILININIITFSCFSFLVPDFKAHIFV